MSISKDIKELSEKDIGDLFFKWFPNSLQARKEYSRNLIDTLYIAKDVIESKLSTEDIENLIDKLNKYRMSLYE